MQTPPHRPEFARLRASLADEYACLIAGLPGVLDVLVPPCPRWTGHELAEHLTHVYLHKVYCMRHGQEPQIWPPALPAGLSVVEWLQQSYGELVAEFDRRAPQDPAYTWHRPDQTVGFWIRRMALETVIHRIDVDLTVGAGSPVIDADIALDCVDELLRIFLCHATVNWPDMFGNTLAKCDGSVVAISAGDRRWLLTLDPGGVQVAEDPDGRADAEVAADPDAVARWAWGRARVEPTVTGRPELVERLLDLVNLAIQ